MPNLRRPHARRVAPGSAVSPLPSAVPPRALREQVFRRFADVTPYTPTNHEQAAQPAKLGWFSRADEPARRTRSRGNHRAVAVAVIVAVAVAVAVSGALLILVGSHSAPLTPGPLVARSSDSTSGTASTPATVRGELPTSSRADSSPSPKRSRRPSVRPTRKHSCRLRRLQNAPSHRRHRRVHLSRRRRRRVRPSRRRRGRSRHHHRRRPRLAHITNGYVEVSFRWPDIVWTSNTFWLGKLMVPGQLRAMAFNPRWNRLRRDRSPPGSSVKWARLVRVATVSGCSSPRTRSRTVSTAANRSRALSGSPATAVQ